MQIFQLVESGMQHIRSKVQNTLDSRNAETPNSKGKGENHNGEVRPNDESQP